MSRVGMVGTLLSGVVLGVVGFGLVRLAALPPPDTVHYHANWAVWINGQRVDFTGDRYMEDVAACAADLSNITAHQRVHMHEHNADVVHVHAPGATWGHLLQNLGWGIGPNWIYTDTGEMYRDGEGGRLTFVLNGIVVPPAYDRVIQDGDRMLISFGSETPEELLNERFPTVASNALEYDENYDPAGCQGTPEETFGDRLRRAFWF
jgi:hypothetical protein